jgi:hypothetical protein
MGRPHRIPRVGMRRSLPWCTSRSGPC